MSLLATIGNSLVVPLAAGGLVPTAATLYEYSLGGLVTGTAIDGTSGASGGAVSVIPSPEDFVANDVGDSTSWGVYADDNGAWRWGSWDVELDADMELSIEFGLLGNNGVVGNLWRGESTGQNVFTTYVGPSAHYIFEVTGGSFTARASSTTMPVTFGGGSGTPTNRFRNRVTINGSVVTSKVYDSSDVQIGTTLTYDMGAAKSGQTLAGFGVNAAGTTANLLVRYANGVAL